MRQESLFPEKQEGKKRGRKKSKSSGASHQAREKFDPRHPLHVTLKLGEGLPSMRGELEYAQIKQGFREGCERPGRLVDGEFRLAHDSVQGNHMHLIVEAGNLESLARGIGGLCIRIAKRLNRLWGRKGKVFAERDHVRPARNAAEGRASALSFCPLLHATAARPTRTEPPRLPSPAARVVEDSSAPSRRALHPAAPFGRAEPP